MSYRIKGLHRVTGESSEFIVDVDTEREALDAASQRGFVVESLDKLKKPFPPKQAVAQAVPKNPELNSELAEKWDLGDYIARVMGILLIIGAFLWYFIQLGNGYGSRFKDDNAIGATANATEAINLKLAFSFYILLGILFYFYSSIRRIRKKLVGI